MQPGEDKGLGDVIQVYKLLKRRSKEVKTELQSSQQPSVAGKEAIGTNRNTRNSA